MLLATPLHFFPREARARPRSPPLVSMITGISVFSVKTRITCWSRSLSAGGASPGLMWETDLAFPPISQHLKNAPGSDDIFFFQNWIHLKTHSRSSWWLLVVGCFVLQEHHWKPEAIEVPCKSKDSWSGNKGTVGQKGEKDERTVFHLRRRNSGLSASNQAAPSLGCWSSTWHSHVTSCVIIFYTIQ